jgi:mersacidin/lichenicidin family type 2 lantibiotic
MSKELIIRAWRDEEYLLSLNDAERALLPDHPAGLVELTDEELGFVVGGAMIGGEGPTAIDCSITHW